MRIDKTQFRWMTWAAHGVAIVGVVLLFLQTRGMTVFCTVAAVLIGCGSVSSVPGRSISTYAAFGSLMGYAFWISVSAINQGEFVSLVPAVLLIIGCAWFLQETRWPSFVFAICVALLLLVMAIASYRNPYDVDGWEPDAVRRSALTAIGVVSLGVMYLCLSFSEGMLAVTRKPKRKRTSATEE